MLLRNLLIASLTLFVLNSEAKAVSVFADGVSNETFGANLPLGLIVFDDDSPDLLETSFLFATSPAATEIITLEASYTNSTTVFGQFDFELFDVTTSEVSLFAGSFTSGTPETFKVENAVTGSGANYRLDIAITGAGQKELAAVAVSAGPLSPVVPVPATLPLLVGSLGALAIVVRRRRMTARALQS
ncbi:MAG: VPLPA-CTERM sorting domain-containing protein [Pseudomonadota bacterium]